MATEVFAFGKNWQAFLKSYLTDERLEEARQSLIAFFGSEEAIKGKTFLDIGCGSGLFSLAAHQLGAKEIISFDVDTDSVRCCEYLWKEEGNPGNWKVLTGSVLDKSFISHLGKFDIVYSWGVLHHTGSMWEAIENASSLVENGGAFYIAIYNKVDHFGFYPEGRFGSSDFWLAEKKFYTKLPRFMQSIFDFMVMFVLVILYLLTLQNPFKKIEEHKKLRGMSWSVDIKDWLGGYPYECATVSEIFRFFHPKGFRLENIKCNNGLLNNEFLFRKI